MIIEEMDNSAVEKEAEFKALVQQGSTAYLNMQFNGSLSKYNDALVMSTEVKIGKMTQTIIKYMICLCLMESNKLQDLAEIVMMMQTVEKPLKDRFPEIYCLLAKAHCKLYRFDEAVTAINEGIAVYKKNRLLETFYIPGTNIPVNQTDENIWLKIKEECLSWHKPDATCNLQDCCNITPPYVTANKNIFLNDPAFNGMVIVHCNNNKRSCSLKFHQCCWKFKKDEMYPFTKVSDKDILGNTCFTPNCQNDNIPCAVSAIEVVGQNGEVKAHIKESLSLHWSGYKNTSKGAIKKTKLTTPKKIENPSEIVEHPVTVKQEVSDDKQISHVSYEDDQILAIKEEAADADFSYEPPNIAGEKNFLFSLFHHYIQNNLVRVSDAYKKFSEISEDLHIKNLDIIEFLVHTNKVEVLSKKSEWDSPPRNQKSFSTPVKTERIDADNLNKTTDLLDDMYNDFMNDDYDDYFEMTDDVHKGNQNRSNKSEQHVAAKGDTKADLHENYRLSSNASNNNFGLDQACGDSSQNTKSVANNCTSYNFPYAQHSNIPDKTTSENLKLKEHIEGLQSQMKEMMNEMSRLKNELKIKDTKIITLTKEQEEFSKEVDKVCERLNNFQLRHDEIKEENLRIKTEMISVMRDKKVLEEKLSEIDNPDSKKQELVKMFQEEYKILEEHINADWKEKTNKLEKTLEDHIKIKNSLLNKCINHQYSSNRNLLKGHIDQCSTALEVICKINIWMESTLSIKNFVDNTEWYTRLNYLKNVQSHYQNEYSQILEKVITEQIEDTEININLPHIPNPPSVSLSESVLNALNTFYKGQCHVMQSAMKLQQQSMAYQVPPMPANNVPYNQFSQQNTYSAYPPPRQPIVANSLMPLPLMNFSMQRMGMPPPLMPQNFQLFSHHPPKLADVISNGNNSKLIDSTNTNLEHDSSSEISSKMENLSINKTEVKENAEEEETAEDEKVPEKEEAVIEKEEEVKSVDQIRIRNEKIAMMKKACKAIALQIQQKTALNNYEDERFDIASNKQLPNENNGEKEDSDFDSKENVVTNSLELACVNSVSNSAVNSSEENIAKQRKKIGIDELIKMMKQKYPESLEVEIIEAISDIRKKHNNSLSKMPVSKILQESDEYMTQKHNLHILRYNKNDGNKSSHHETPTKSSGPTPNGKKVEMSPASSCNSLNKVEESPAQKKKTWNKISQREVQWTSSGEIECSICMSLVSNKANCYTLSCRHSFHKQCVKSWLKSDRSCPNCRIAVTEDDEFPPLPA